MFHLHKWQEVGRTYNPPMYAVKRVWGDYDIPKEVFLNSLGYTNIELKCSKCGDIKVIQEYGKVDKHVSS